jgi:hypothetical protein
MEGERHNKFVMSPVCLCDHNAVGS